MAIDIKSLTAAVLSGCRESAARHKVYAASADGMAGNDWEQALVAEYITGAIQALDFLCRSDGLATPGQVAQAVHRAAAELGLHRAQ